LGFRVPEAPLTLGYLMLPIFRNFGSVHSDIWDMGALFILGYFILSLKRKDKQTFIMTVMTIITCCIVFYTHRYYATLWGKNSNIYHEIRETMFSILCFIYAIQLNKDVKEII
jgi:hypothetical protein